MSIENNIVKDRLLEIYTNCSTRLKRFEIWPGYYRIRYLEFEKYYALLPKKHFTKTLEIGCGIGYQAVFLSCISDNVTASDVDFGDMIQHSRGLDIAREFIRESGIGNIEVTHADAKQLPFEDEQFDLVYCSYSFQYIPDKDKALHEISRVLKKGGYFLCVLPTTAYRLKALGNYYSVILKKLPTLLSKVNKKRAPAESGSGTAVVTKKYTKLFPPPDDDNNSFLSELYLYSPLRWTKLFKKNGHKIAIKKYSDFKPENKRAGMFSAMKETVTSAGIIYITTK